MVRLSFVFTIYTKKYVDIGQKRLVLEGYYEILNNFLKSSIKTVV